MSNVKMKMNKKFIPYILMGLCVLAFGLYVLLTRGMWDHTPPRLTVPETVLKVPVRADEKALLAGITAVDETDGDVTGLVVVESVSDVYEGSRATVTYAAFDRSGNVSKGRRTLEYTDYQSPRFTLKEPLIFREGSGFDVFKAVGAVDSVDGVLDDKVKGTLVQGSGTVYEAGIHQVEFRVTNSLGDTTHLTMPVEVYTHERFRRQIQLDQYLIYLKRGEAFDPMSLIGRESRGVPMDVDSDVNTEQPGVYSVIYTDQAGEIYGKTRLVVVVEE